MACNCHSEGLSNFVAPRPMTSWEVARFLTRHPVVAMMLANTEATMQAGLYNYDYNPATDWMAAGVIRPWGIQILGDSEFGNVTIFPKRGDNTWSYTAFSPILGDINNPDYVSETFPEGIAAALIGDAAAAASTLSNIVLLAGGIYAAFLLWSQRKKKK